MHFLDLYTTGIQNLMHHVCSFLPDFAHSASFGKKKAQSQSGVLPDGTDLPGPRAVHVQLPSPFYFFSDVIYTERFLNDAFL